MIRPYHNPSNVPIVGTTLLVISTVVLAALYGAFAYEVSQFLYLAVLFPLIAGFVAALGYRKLTLFAKVRQPALNALLGILAGVIIAVSFYATPYLIVQHDYVSQAWKAGMDNQTAVRTFDQKIVEDTGLGGLMGFMQLRAMDGEHHQLNMMVGGSAVVPVMDYTLQGTTLWIYWIIEAILFCVPLAYISYEMGDTLEFNSSAGDWYRRYPRDIASVPLEYKEAFLSLVLADDPRRIGQLALPGDELPHPKIELLERRSLNRRGAVMLIAKETKRVTSSKVVRSLLGRWEIPADEYPLLSGELEPDAATTT